MKEVIMQVAAYSSDYPKAPIYVADLVRCKECKYRKKNGFCLEHNRYEKNDNGYCSYGVKKGADDE